MTSGSGVLGVVLAGGSSRRMGRDKALVEIDGESLVALAARKLGAVCDRLVLADGGRALLPTIPSVPDGAARGPAAGILGAAARAGGSPILVLACDLPRIPLGLLRKIAAGAADWVVPRWEGGIEPLCALYTERAIEALVENVSRDVLAPHRLAERSDLDIRFVEGADLSTHGDPSELFTNLNRPTDLDRLTGP